MASTSARTPTTAAAASASWVATPSAPVAASATTNTSGMTPMMRLYRETGENSDQGGHGIPVQIEPERGVPDHSSHLGAPR